VVVEQVVAVALQAPVVEQQHPPRLAQLLRQRPPLLQRRQHQLGVGLAVLERPLLELVEAQPLLVVRGADVVGELADPVPDAHDSPRPGGSSPAIASVVRANASTASAADSIRPANSRAVWCNSVSTQPSSSSAGGFSA